MHAAACCAGPAAPGGKDWEQLPGCAPASPLGPLAASTPISVPLPPRRYEHAGVGGPSMLLQPLGSGKPDDVTCLVVIVPRWHPAGLSAGLTLPYACGAAGAPAADGAGAGSAGEAGVAATAGGMPCGAVAGDPAAESADTEAAAEQEPARSQSAATSAAGGPPEPPVWRQAGVPTWDKLHLVRSAPGGCAWVCGGDEPLDGAPPGQDGHADAAQAAWWEGGSGDDGWGAAADQWDEPEADWGGPAGCSEGRCGADEQQAPWAPQAGGWAGFEQQADAQVGAADGAAAYGSSHGRDDAPCSAAAASPFAPSQAPAVNGGARCGAAIEDGPPGDAAHPGAVSAHQDAERSSGGASDGAANPGSPPGSAPAATEPGTLALASGCAGGGCEPQGGCCAASAALSEEVRQLRALVAQLQAQLRGASLE